MKIIRIILLFIIFLGIKGYAAEKYILKEHDPMNLIGDKSIVQNNYNYNGTNLYYSETFINQDKKGPAAAILVIHSGIEKSNKQTLKHLTFPGLQSLVKYTKEHGIKVLIIAPQYPIVQDTKNYNYASLQLLKDKVQQYNIPNDRIFILGASNGALAVNDILNENQDYFAKAVFVSSILSAENFDKTHFKTQLYIIQGENDMRKSKLKFYSDCKEKHIKTNLVIIKDADHYKTLDMTIGYPDYMWRWLFKYTKKNIFKNMYSK